jgi:hypothetical protein
MAQEPKIGILMERYVKSQNIKKFADSMKRLVNGEDSDSSEEEGQKNFDEQVRSYTIMILISFRHQETLL